MIRFFIFAVVAVVGLFLYVERVNQQDEELMKLCFKSARCSNLLSPSCHRRPDLSAQ